MSWLPASRIPPSARLFPHCALPHTGVHGGATNLIVEGIFEGLGIAAEPTVITLGLAEEDTLVIGKLADLENGVRPGEKTLDFA